MHLNNQCETQKVKAPDKMVEIKSEAHQQNCNKDKSLKELLEDFDKSITRRNLGILL